MSQLTIRTLTVRGVVGLLGLFAAGCGQKADEEVVDDEVVDAEVADGVVVDGELVDGEVTERGRLRDRIVAAAPPRVADRIEDREEIRENRRETFKDCGISISDECQAERQGNREEARKTRRENRRAVIAGLSPMESDMIHEFREMAIAARPCLDGIPGGMFSEFTSDPTLFFQSRMKFDADSFEFDDIDLQTTSALTILNQALPEGPAKCILGVADEKFSGQMVEARNNLIAEFTDFAEQMRDKAREKVAAVIADKLKDALTSDTSTDLLTPEELKAVANDVLVNLLIAKLNNASNHLSTLTDNLG
ncbi:MAG: hypothetical protein OES26_27790, partial [Gammaproteobacteria bacterium]|nr:hypothetical protein [Gammaproteobacteria bacterium]